MSGEGAERFRDDCLRHVVVAQDARAGSGQETSVSTEVSAVVDLVLDHARRLPGRRSV